MTGGGQATLTIGASGHTDCDPHGHSTAPQYCQQIRLTDAVNAIFPA